MRKWWILATVALVSVAAAAAAFATGGASSPASVASPATADAAVIKCGKVRTLGFSAPGRTGMATRTRPARSNAHTSSPASSGSYDPENALGRRPRRLPC